jgi:glutamyl-tRNA synthetase
MTICTRFAPSPTGYLHVGGARTALFSYLFAKKNKGQFRLRIEDTDQERSTEASVQAILDGLQWLGLNWDEPPVYQTHHFDRYYQVALQLLEAGHAYRCYCTKERLEALREEQITRKAKPRYDGCCRDKAFEDINGPYVVRYKNPAEGQTSWQDLVHGVISFENTELDDLIILRTDNTPTYNFTVVVDDMDMQMTHVLRGDDHINNTPRQLNIFKALKVAAPQYGHLPMILGDDGQRLSKRHGAVSVMQYRDEGYLPEALLNHLVRLGWSHGDQEIFSRDEMVSLFNVENINKSPAAFNTEKLLWLNQHYMKTLAHEYVAGHLAWQMKALAINTDLGPSLIDVVKAQAERVKTLKEMAEKSQYFYTDDLQYDPISVEKHFSKDCIDFLKLFITKLEEISSWEKEKIHGALEKLIAETGLKLGKIGPTVRVAVTGSTSSPSLDITLFLIGKNRSIQRLKQAISMIHKMPV